MDSRIRVDVEALAEAPHSPGSGPDAFRYDVLIERDGRQVRLHAQDPHVPAQLRGGRHRCVTAGDHPASGRSPAGGAPRSAATSRVMRWLGRTPSSLWRSRRNCS